MILYVKSVNMKNPQEKVIVITISNFNLDKIFESIHFKGSCTGTGLSWFFKDFCYQKFNSLPIEDVCNIVFYAYYTLLYS